MDGNRRRIMRLFARLRAANDAQTRRITYALGVAEYLTNQLEEMMANNAELAAKITELEEAVAADEAQDDANETALEAVITDLRAQLAAGTDTQPFIDRLEAIKANLHAPTPE